MAEKKEKLFVVRTNASVSELKKLGKVEDISDKLSGPGTKAVWGDCVGCSGGKMKGLKGLR